MARSVHVLTTPIDAVVAVPGSKSIANRALVCAALADGVSELRRVAPGDDTQALIGALRVLGHRIDGPEAGTVRVQGGHPTAWPAGAVVHAALAGTTSRFLTALAALADGPITIDGDEPLRHRPMGPLHDALRTLGADVRVDGPGGLPVTVRGPLRGGRVSMPGDVSSQFLTALMLIGPRLATGLEIELTTPLVSRPYVEMTAAVMAAFGVHGVEVGATRVVVPASTYRAQVFEVEPDASSASYPLAAAAIRGGRVTVTGLGRSSVQGDAAFAELLADMGAVVERTDDATTVVGTGGALRGLGDIDLADMSDLVPTVAVVAALASSPTRIRGVGFIRAKESDRIGDLVAELRRCGASVREHDDGLDIDPVDGGAGALVGARLGTHHDHRLALALSLLGLVVPGIEIEDPDVVSKSWPDWWRVLDTLGLPAEAGPVVAGPVVAGPVVAAFDVDGTLTRRDSLVPFLWRTAALRLVTGLLRRPLVLLGALARRDRDRLKELAVGAVFRGRPVAPVLADGARYADELHTGALRADVLARLQWHLGAGHRVVLVSASLGPYLHPLAAHLGVDAALCTELAASADGTYTGALVGGNCRGPAKVDRLEGWLATQGLTDATIWAYGDSPGDHELLARADRATFVGGRPIDAVPDTTHGEERNP